MTTNTHIAAAALPHRQVENQPYMAETKGPNSNDNHSYNMKKIDSVDPDNKSSLSQDIDKIGAFVRGYEENQVPESPPRQASSHDSRQAEHAHSSHNHNHHHHFHHNAHRAISSVANRLEHPFPKLRQHLNQESRTAKLLANLSHAKHEIGKLANIVNPNHRHDEEHERRTDDARSTITDSHRYHSFAPVTTGNNVKWYVDGRDYFHAVSIALERAQQVIYIADWWLSPELFLRRPPYLNQEWRLDQVLKRKAEQGVMIYIIVYKEVESALTCNSRHTKDALHALCPDGSPGADHIIVMRHPDHNVLQHRGDMTFFWAHHEKFLVVDFGLAFLGGLDLCFGRWDTHTHTMADVHPESVELETWPGQDFNNNRLMDFYSVQDWDQNQVSKAEYGRMPWHDVSMAVTGPAVLDIAEHFVLRWNHCKRDKYKRHDRYPWLVLKSHAGENESLIGVQRPKYDVGGYDYHPFLPIDPRNFNNPGTVSCQILRSSADWSSGILKEHSIMNAYCDIIRKARHFVYIENQFFITSTSDQQSPIHNHIGKAIVDAVLAAAREHRKFRIIVLLPAIPGFAGDLRDSKAVGTRAIMDYQYKSIKRGKYSIFSQIEENNVDPTQYIFFFNLRSYDRLNTTPNIKKQELRSGVSYKAVQSQQAKETMSTSVGSPENGKGHDDTGNLKEEKLVDHKKRFEEHRDTDDVSPGASQDSIDESTKPYTTVYTNIDDDDSDHIKLGDKNADSPASTGNGKSVSIGIGGQEATEAQNSAKTSNDDSSNDDDTTSGANKAQALGIRHSKTSNSIAHCAMLKTGNVSDESWIPGAEDLEIQNIIQEELYIHAKVLIADDRIAICGSANINDRSQLGDHDSEIAMVIEDTQMLKSTMDGKEYEAGHAVATLRRYLWREHLGLLPPQSLEVKDEDGSGMLPQDAPAVASRQEDEEEDKSVADPLSEELWKTWCDSASTNTEIFRELFHCDPDDSIRTLDDYKDFTPNPKEDKAHKAGHIYPLTISVSHIKKQLDQIKGHLVWMPLDFLDQEKELAEKGLSVNSVTESIYT